MRERECVCIREGECVYEKKEKEVQGPRLG